MLLLKQAKHMKQFSMCRYGLVYATSPYFCHGGRMTWNADDLVVQCSWPIVFVFLQITLCGMPIHVLQIIWYYVCTVHLSVDEGILLNYMHIVVCSHSALHASAHTHLCCQVSTPYFFKKIRPHICLPLKNCGHLAARVDITDA